MLVCLPLAAPIGLSPLYIPTPCGSKRVLGVSTEPLDDMSCLTPPGSGEPPPPPHSDPDFIAGNNEIYNR